MKMPSLKQTILLVGTPAVILVGGLTAMAASAAESAVEASDPALPGGGHADAANQNADHQFEGIE
jgi:hypothetical protein